MKTVVITGTSTGIGYDAARALIERGYRVFGSVRKKEDGERVRSALGQNFTPLQFDVTDQDGILTAAQTVQDALDEGQKLAGLVNNAGIAVAGPLMYLPVADFRFQMEVNVVGVMAITQAFLPLLGASKGDHPKGRIVNISSVGGQLSFPFMGPYSASKHALEAMSDSLRRELMIYGIDVIIIEPGSIKTPIWDKAAELDLEPYAATDYGKYLQAVKDFMVAEGKNGFPVEYVSKTILTALESPKPKSRYALPNNKITGWIIPRLLPDRRLDRVIAKQLFGI